jgi:hypothetical protein
MVRTKLIAKGFVRLDHFLPRKVVEEMDAKCSHDLHMANISVGLLHTALGMPRGSVSAYQMVRAVASHLGSLPELASQWGASSSDLFADADQLEDDADSFEVDRSGLLEHGVQLEAGDDGDELCSLGQAAAADVVIDIEVDDEDAVDRAVSDDEDFDVASCDAGGSDVARIIHPAVDSVLHGAEGLQY